MGNFKLFLLECRQLRHDGVFWATASVWVLVLVFGLVNGQSWRDSQSPQITATEQQNRDSETAQKQQAAALRQQNAAKAEGKAAREGDSRYALGYMAGTIPTLCLHPSVISALAVGQSDLNNPCAIVSPWEKLIRVRDHVEDTGGGNLEHPLRLFYGRFDIAFVMITLVPIVILVLTYNLLSGERELGTYFILRYQSISLTRIIVARMVARALTLLLLTFVPIVWLLWQWGTPLDDPGTLWELALWFIVTTAYIIFWFACSFWVNAYGKSSAENGLILAGIWLLLVVIVPGCLNLGLKQLYPMPSRMEFIDANREATVEVSKKKTELLGKYLIDHPDKVKLDKTHTVDDFIQTHLAIDEETRRVLEPHRTEFDVQKDRQHRLVEGLRFLSPAIVYQQISLLLTGQGQERLQRFHAAVETYRAALREFYLPRLLHDSPDFNDYEAVPRFKFQELAIVQQLPQVLSACAGLMIPTLVFAIFGWHRLRRLVTAN